MPGRWFEFGFAAAAASASKRPACVRGAAYFIVLQRSDRPCVRGARGETFAAPPTCRHHVRGLNVENKFYVRPETACVLRYFFIIYKIRLRENGFESIIFTAFVIRKYRVDVWVDHSQTVDRVLCTYVKKRKYFSTVHPVRSVLPGGGVMGFKRSPPPNRVDGLIILLFIN